jgi:hypothetical protein
VKIQVEVFWVVTPCSVVVGYQCFGEPFCLHVQGEVTYEGDTTAMAAAIFQCYLTFALPFQSRIFFVENTSRHNFVAYVSVSQILLPTKYFVLRKYSSSHIYIYI